MKKDKFIQELLKYFCFKTFLPEHLIKKIIYSTDFDAKEFIISYILKYYKIKNIKNLIDNLNENRRLNYINFDILSQYQPLDFEFLLGYKEFLNYDCLLKNKHIKNLNLTESQELVILSNTPDSLKSKLAAIFIIQNIKNEFIKKLKTVGLISIAIILTIFLVKFIISLIRLLI